MVCTGFGLLDVSADESTELWRPNSLECFANKNYTTFKQSNFSSTNLNVHGAYSQAGQTFQKSNETLIHQIIYLRCIVKAGGYPRGGSIRRVGERRLRLGRGSGPGLYEGTPSLIRCPNSQLQSDCTLESNKYPKGSNIIGNFYFIPFKKFVYFPFSVSRFT